MTDNPETLRSYAAILEKPRRHEPGGTLWPPTEVCVAAAKALRQQASSIEYLKQCADDAIDAIFDR